MVIDSNKQKIMKLVDFGLSKSRYATTNYTATESSKLFKIIFSFFESLKYNFEFILEVSSIGMTEYYAAPEVLMESIISEKSDW